MLGTLRVDRAVLIELINRAVSGWHFAPQVRVTETSGAGSVQVTSVEIGIPGGQTRWTCVSGYVLAAGQTIELFGDFYGEYPISFSQSGDRVSGDATIVVHFADRAGPTGSITVTRPPEPGGLPNSYTGGSTNVGPCKASAVTTAAVRVGGLKDH